MKQNWYNISSFSIIVLFVCLSLIGLGMLYYVPFQSSATTELPSISVSFSMHKQYTPRIVENEVTNKLEQALSRIEGMRDISSESSESGGSINIKMLPGTDMEKTRFLVTTNINKIWDEISNLCNYPRVTIPKTGGSVTTSFMSYSIRANKTMSNLSDFVERKVKPMLVQVKGVEEVRFSERQPFGYLLKYKQSQLDNMNIDIESIIKAIEDCNTSSVLGLMPYSEDGHTSIMRFNMQSDTDLTNLANLQLTISDGSKIPLSSIVSIVPDEDNEISSQRINGQNTMFIDIVTKDNVNQILVSRNIKAAMAEFIKELSSDYTIALENDKSETLKTEVYNIGIRLVLTVIIILVFIFISVRNLRLVLDIMLSLIVAMLIAFIGYAAFGVEINMYALAAITISSNLMIDNIIVMSNQVLYRKNINAFMPMFTATITTVGALSIVFFMSDTQKITLKDFSAVLIINLTASLLVATFFVPALLEQTGMTDSNHATFTPNKLKVLHLFNRSYERIIIFARRFRTPLCVMLIISFGLPTFLLPIKVEGDGKWAELYNDTFGSPNYNENIRQKVDKWIGGALYRFNSYNEEKDEEELKKFLADRPTISMSAKLPSGASRDMIEVPIKRMERFLASQSDIKQFNTSINSNTSATIDIYFDKHAKSKGSALTLRAALVKKALSISGLSWSIGGPGNMSFANTPISSSGEHEINMIGYNFDQLMRYANQFKDTLESIPRIHNVSLCTSFDNFDNKAELSFNISPQSLDKYGITITEIISELMRQYGTESTIRVNRNGGIALLSSQSDVYVNNDIWALMNIPLQIKGNDVKLSDLGTFEKHTTPMSIYKRDQQYCVYILYDYKGSSDKAWTLPDAKMEEFNKIMPMGYKVSFRNNRINFGGTKYTMLILLVIVGIIYVTTCVLLNSLIRPFAIILVIPISFIGVFLAFSSMHLPFGDGGMASMVLLCGLAVNANIYLTYEYIEVRRKNPYLNQAKAFVKSWNHKIGPVFLTIFSTILGFLPFVMENHTSDFWYALSVGTIAGLATTAVGIFVFLPIFLIKLKKK